MLCMPILTQLGLQLIYWKTIQSKNNYIVIGRQEENIKLVDRLSQRSVLKLSSYSGSLDMLACEFSCQKYSRDFCNRTTNMLHTKKYVNLLNYEPKADRRKLSK